MINICKLDNMMINNTMNLQQAHDTFTCLYVTLKGIDFLHLRENSVFCGSFEITTHLRMRYRGIRHWCHSKEETVF